MTEEVQQQAIATAHLRAFLESREFKPIQRTDNEKLYGGGMSLGLWIYRNPKGHFWGVNCAKEEHCFQAELISWNKRNDYLNDLRHIILAVRDVMNTKERQSDYARNLGQIINDQRRKEPRFMGSTAYDYATATPAMHCEAFLKTLNLWTP